MKHGFFAEASSEYFDAILFYNEQRQGLGQEFADEVDLTLKRILAGPTRWPKIELEIRRCLVNRFPYGLLYIEEDGVVKILAVMHLKREPGYWRTRLQ